MNMHLNNKKKALDVIIIKKRLPIGVTILHINLTMIIIFTNIFHNNEIS